MFARSSLVVAFGTAANAYMTLRLLGAAATVIRPTPEAAVTPVARVHVAPSLVEYQICPSVVPVVAAEFASSVSTKRCSPAHASDQPYGAPAAPVAIDTGAQVPPLLVERNKPLLVVTRTTLVASGDTMICVVTVESPRKDGADHVAPPSDDLTRPMPVPSNGSPRPRYSVALFTGSISSQPVDRLPSVSVIGAQFAPASLAVQTPPADIAT